MLLQHEQHPSRYLSSCIHVQEQSRVLFIFLFDSLLNSNGETPWGCPPIYGHTSVYHSVIQQDNNRLGPSFKGLQQQNMATQTASSKIVVASGSRPSGLASAGGNTKGADKGKGKEKAETPETSTVENIEEKEKSK